ncbi:hypothetical protein [Parasphingorhabdus sp.]|uniref:hypothetical protein n=1 Tax=Parasphingorhabdus sp. TaxID=2709688 RepID=UPI003001BC5D
MTFQDEFARRLNAARGVATGDGGEDTPDKAVRLERSRETGDDEQVSRLRSTRTDGNGEHIRHPEFISGPLEAEPEDRGARDRVLKRVQDDDSMRLQGDGGVDATTPSPAIRHDGWHLDLRVKFLEALAQTGNVQASAYFVQRTRQSAYDLKRRDPDFARAWLAALVLAREEAQDKLQERAIEGVEEEIFYHGEVVATRRRYDSRLLLAHLARLDKIAAEIPAQRGAARFGDMLKAIGAGEDTAPLIATPTEEELAVRAAEAELHPEPEVAEEEEGAEFYEIHWPDDDGPPEYYQMSPEEAAEMERDVPGLVAKATGTADDAVITPLAIHAEAQAQFEVDRAAVRKNL